MFHGTVSFSTGHIPPPIIHLQPGDVILLQSPHRVPKAHMQDIMAKTKDLFPDHRIVFFADGLTLTAARETQDCKTQDTRQEPA